MTGAIQMAMQKDMIGTLCIADQAALTAGDRSQLHTGFLYDCVLKQLQKTVRFQAKAIIMLNHTFWSYANACRKSGVSLEQPFDIFHKVALDGKQDGTLQQVTIRQTQQVLGQGLTLPYSVAWLNHNCNHLMDMP